MEGFHAPAPCPPDCNATGYGTKSKTAARRFFPLLGAAVKGGGDRASGPALALRVNASL